MRNVEEDAPVADRSDDDDDTATGRGRRRRSPGDRALEATVLPAGPLFAVLSRSDERAFLADAGIDCLEASSGGTRTRVPAALRTRSARRVR